MTISEFENLYRDREFVGSGGFARVYKTFDHEKACYVALKTAPVRPEHRQYTLEREANIVNALPPHPNIIRYESCHRFDLGIGGLMDVAILEFYEHGNLEQFLNTRQLTESETKNMVKGILRGTGFLHQHNITHRDLKSQNILIKREFGIWSPKICDFGLAREMETNQLITDTSVGITYSYASPEQIKGQKISKMVDIWAVGVIVYRILAGELPFRVQATEDQTSRAQAELARKITNLELPEKLSTIVEPYQTLIRRCLVDPFSRAQSAEELLALLDPRPQTMEAIAAQASIAQPVLPPVAPPPVLEDDKTDVIRTAKEPVPKTYEPWAEPVPAVIYPHPKPDYTQVLDRKSGPPPPSKPAVPQINVGEPKRTFNWRWALALLLLAGLGYGAYRYVNRDTSPGEVEKVDFTVNDSVSQDGILDTFKVFVGERVVFFNTSTPEKNVKTLVWSFVKDSVLISSADNNSLVTMPFQEIGLFQIRLCVNGAVNCVTKLMLVQERSSLNLAQIPATKPTTKPTEPVYGAPEVKWTEGPGAKVEIENPTPAPEPVKVTVAAPVIRQPEPVSEPVPEPVLPPSSSPAQQKPEVPPKVKVVPDVEPKYPGGPSALSKFFAKNMKYPPSAVEEGLEGKVVVQFDVDEDGSVSNVKVIEKLGSACDEEAVRLIKKMPKWTPGQRNGSNMKMRLKQSIRFKLD